jgi:2-oxoglutarate ferredoxin oxidoreductase subunit delta
MKPIVPRRALDLAKRTIPQGQVYVIPQRCKGCLFCIEFCPKDVLVESTEMNAKGYHFPVVAEGKQGECANCEFCTLICPEFAIFTVQREAVAQ